MVFALGLGLGFDFDFDFTPSLNMLPMLDFFDVADLTTPLVLGRGGSNAGRGRLAGLVGDMEGAIATKGRRREGRAQGSEDCQTAGFRSYTVVSRSRYDCGFLRAKAPSRVVARRAVERHCQGDFQRTDSDEFKQNAGGKTLRPVQTIILRSIYKFETASEDLPLSSCFKHVSAERCSVHDLVSHVFISFLPFKVYS